MAQASTCTSGSPCFANQTETLSGPFSLGGIIMSQPDAGQALALTLPSDQVTVTTPPRLRSVFVSVRDDSFDGEVVVVVGFLAVVVVVDDFADFLESEFDLAVEVVVEDDVVSARTVAVVVVDDDVAAAAASISGPAVAPGRGSVLAGDVGAGVDVAPAEGLAGAASVEGDGGGVAAVSGAGLEAATSPPSGATGTARAACRARRTSGCDRGDTREVANRDETSCTPNNPRSTPLAVPRAHVTTRTRRTAKWWRPPPHEDVKTKLNHRQGSRLRG